MYRLPLVNINKKITEKHDTYIYKIKNTCNVDVDCLSFLLRQKHDTHQLMEDWKFIFDLMVCGKTKGNEPLQEFILQSPAPIDTAVKLSSLYREMSEKEKERAKDLNTVATFAENIAVELLGISASKYNAALLLKAKDNRLVCSLLKDEITVTDK